MPDCVAKRLIVRNNSDKINWNVFCFVKLGGLYEKG